MFPDFFFRVLFLSFSLSLFSNGIKNYLGRWGALWSHLWVYLLEFVRLAVSVILCFWVMWFSFGSYQGSVVSGFGSISKFISAEGRFLLRKRFSLNVPLVLGMIEFVFFFFFSCLSSFLQMSWNFWRCIITRIPLLFGHWTRINTLHCSLIPAWSLLESFHICMGIWSCPW